eukprot:2597143-Rhodomonas_salina.1
MGANSRLDLMPLMENECSARTRRADTPTSAAARDTGRSGGFGVWSSRRFLSFLFLAACWNPTVVRSSHGIWKDPYGRAVISDEPSMWWRMDNASRGGSASCN